MSELIGKQVQCNRCNTTIFLKFIEKESHGFSDVDRYEKLPDDWLYENQIGHLCPDCAYLFRSFIADLMAGARIAPSWSLDRHNIST